MVEIAWIKQSPSCTVEVDAIEVQVVGILSLFGSISRKI